MTNRIYDVLMECKFGCRIITLMILLIWCSILIVSYSSCKKKSNDVYYTVIFNSMGGSSVNPIKIISNGKINEPAMPTYTGYNFEGWYIDPSFQNIFDFATGITANTTLYAKWTKGLEMILIDGIIPADLSVYDEVSQSVLKHYPVGSSLVAVYVTQTGAGLQTGNSWANAKSDVQEAIESITDASDTKVYLLLVATGIYTTKNEIAMKNNVAIIGGWGKFGNFSRPAKDTTVFDGNKSHRIFYNEYTKESSLTNKALLYGVKITNGLGTLGGGMYNYYASPVISNVIFLENTAFTAGGGMYNYYASPVISNVIFSGNTASIWGGGVYNVSSSPILNNTSFSGNTATYGGGINNIFSSSLLNNVLFAGNRAFDGGGMYNESSAPVVSNVTFVGNNAILYGGGIYNESSSPSLNNVTFWGNSATDAASDGGGVFSDTSSRPVVVGSIFWNNIAIKHAQYAGSDSVYYSVIQGNSATKVAPDNRGNNGDNPSLITSFQQYAGIAVLGFTGLSPVDIGLYVKRSKYPTGTSSIDQNVWSTYTIYYSIDNSSWFNDPTLKTSIALPAEVVDLTAIDATGYMRLGTPDAGAFEKR